MDERSVLNGISGDKRHSDRCRRENGHLRTGGRGKDLSGGTAAGSGVSGLRGQHLEDERPAAAQAHQLGDAPAGSGLRAGIPRTAAERLAIAQLCSKHQVNGIEGFGYGKGWEYEAEEIGRFLDSTERLVQAGVNVALLCHAVTRKASLPEIDAEFDHWELKLGNKTTNKIAPLLKEWSDITLFLAFQTHVIATDDKGKKHKATACNRVMYTTKTAWWDAKNRFGLPEMLPLEYASIASIFTAPAPTTAPKPKTQQVIEKAQAAGLPTEKDLAESELLITANGQLPEPQQTAEDVQTQHILDGIAPQLAQLMAVAQVQPSELQAVVGSKGYFPADMPVQNYPQDFVEGWCIPWWQNIMGMIQQNRR